MLKKLISLFRKKTDGSTAIETAMVAPVFFALTFSTFEVGHVFFKQSIIEEAAYAAARQVRVGQAVAADYVNEDASGDECSTGRECFYDDVCERVEIFGDCSKYLSIEVRQFASFEEVVAAADEGMKCPNNPGYVFDAQPYEPGRRNEVIRVRICYLIRTFNPAIGLNLANNEDGTRSIIAIAIHRNEPYLDSTDTNPNEGL